MQKGQKAILNDLKETLKTQFPFIRYVRREGNSVKFFAGNFKSPINPSDGVWDIATKQQQQRGFIPLGVEEDLMPYKQFIDGLKIPGAIAEIIWIKPFITPMPTIVVTLAN